MEQKPRGTALSRRGFLKAAAAVGAAGFAGASLTGIAASAAQAEPTANETLGFTYHNEHCLCNCMLQCTVRDGRLAMIQPRENEDKRFQNVCLKGISEVQNIYGDARIQRPMKRVGERGSGEFEAISWDEAFQMIAENFKAIQDKYGKEALWIQFSTEASQRFPPLLPSVLGAQTSSMNGYDLGQGNGQFQAFSPWIGLFAQNTIWQWDEAAVVLMANCNLVEASLTWARAMMNAQEAGTKIICLDPRFSPTASKADQWVGLRAGTDPAFFLGMTKYILDEELYDREHVLAHTALPFLIDPETGLCLADVAEAVDPETGEPVEVKTFYMWDEATNAAVPHTTEGATPALEGEFTVNGKRYVTQFTRLRKDMEPYTLEWASATCDVPVEVIVDVATQYAKGPSIICNSVGGIDKFYNNDVAGHCYALIASLTGNYGKRGTGCGIYGYHVTPYEAALGAWVLPEGMAPVSTQGFFDVVKDNAVHGAMFFGDIPTQKAANWNKTLEWIDSLDFVALADIYHSSVADFVDLVLPVCSKFECADEVGGVKCANAHILANLKVLDPLFESKSDFYIEKGIAEAMGLGDLFPADGEEYARALLSSDDPQMAGFTLETLKENNGAQRLIGSEELRVPEIGFEYTTPSGRQEPYYENMLEFGQAFPAWEAPCEAYPENPLREKYPLQFNQARSRFRVHSAYSGAKWIQEVAEPCIELNPADAATRGLEDGDAVEVFNDRGSFRTVLHLNEAVRPDSAFMVESTYRQYLDGTIMQSVSNDQLNERGYVMPFGPMIPFNDTLIEIKKAGE